jgi:signal transduction histidine kinase
MRLPGLLRPRTVPHLPARTVRLRLTLLYGALFTVCGAALLAITYLLVRSTGGFVLVNDGTPELNSNSPYLGTGEIPERMQGLAQPLYDQAVRQRDAELDYLLVQSAIALAIMVAISVALGWLVAGRILRPLRAITATTREITARNLHERLAIEGPRDELKDLADTIDGLLGRLETAFDAQKRFVANAAHELRTPLTFERALLEETLTDPGATPTSYRSTVERLLAISQQHGHLLDALLTLASSERGLDHREPFDLSTLTEQVLGTYLPEIDRLGLRIETRIAPAPTTGDPALAERLVANLLDNAVRYNLAGGRIELTTAIRTDRAQLSIANTGPIIPPAQVGRLFEPFERLGDRAAHNDGHHGLGLSIARAITAAHDATLTATPRSEGGLAIDVSFPPSPGHRDQHPAELGPDAHTPTPTPHPLTGRTRDRADSTGPI